MSENDLTAKTVKAPAARFGGKGLNAGIAAAAVLTAAGLALWGFQLSGGLVQTGMRNLDSWGPLHHPVHVPGGPVGWRPHHLVGAARVRHEGLRRHLQGGRVDVHLLHGARHRLRGGGPGAPGAPVGTVRVLEPGLAAHVGHHRAGRYLILSIVYLWATLRAEEGKVSAVACALLA